MNEQVVYTAMLLPQGATRNIQLSNGLRTGVKNKIGVNTSISWMKLYLVTEMIITFMFQ